MAQGRPLHAKLFLEGKEVPFIGASVTHTVNQAAIAYIDLVPHQTINNIKPRTHVLLSVRDFTDQDNGFPYVDMFEGEVFGFSLGKTPESRSFSISCIDYTSYWDNVLAYFFNYTQSLGKGVESTSAVGFDINALRKFGFRAQAVTHSMNSYFIQIMRDTLKQPGKDFLDGLVEVYKNISSTNEFYSLAEERLKIIDRILLRSSGRLNQLLEVGQGLDWFTGVLGRESGFTTLRQVIQDLMSLIFHDSVSIPFPAKVSKTNFSSAKPLRPTNSSSDKKTVGQFIFKPNLYMVPPPACNIFFPDEYSQFSFSRNFFQEPTRMMYSPELPRSMGGGEVMLQYVYQPDSLQNFMFGTKPGARGSKDTDTELDQGFFGSPDTSPSSATNAGVKREPQFLTNEELMKGIFLAREAMVPNSTQFRASLTDVGKRSFSERVSRYLFFKKRFENRQIQITSHLKPSVIPGFSALILDDSDADQNIVAYCDSVTHRIYATQGGYTNVTLSYARTVNEQDASSNQGGEPLIPPWFAEEIFGFIQKPPDSESAKQEVRDAGQVLVTPPALSEFFKGLIGDKGYKSITNLYKSEPTMIGSTRRILQEYRDQKKRGNTELQAFIAKMTRRDYVRLRESFQFIGGTTQDKDDFAPFMEFFGSNLTGEGRGDSGVLKNRRSVIDQYRKVLKEKRGFRG